MFTPGPRSSRSSPAYSPALAGNSQDIPANSPTSPAYLPISPGESQSAIHDIMSCGQMSLSHALLTVKVELLIPVCLPTWYSVHLDAAHRQCVFSGPADQCLKNGQGMVRLFHAPRRACADAYVS